MARAPGRLQSGAVAVVVAVAMVPGPGQGQDLEVESQRTGVPLPPAYHALVAEDPLAFELPNGFFGDRRSLPPVRAPGLVPQQTHRVYEGAARFPVILALFADSPEPWLSAEDVEAALFTGPAAHGTLTDYYLEASGGRFHVGGDVSPWVRSSLSRDEVVGSQYGLGDDAQVGAYLLEALSLADETLDFGLYDNDGPDGVPNSGDDDGIADLVTFEFLEISASCGGPGIWPHRSGITRRTDGEPWTSNDLRPDGTPVVVDGYIIQGATNCWGTAVQTSHTIAHEFGHALGLPDYYHPVSGITPESRRWVLGCWDLMAAGAWGCGPVGTPASAFGPTHLSAWNRHLLGWLDFQEVGAVRDSVFELRPVRTSAHALRVPLGDLPEDGALLLEFRDQGGFDGAVPAAGVLVTRIDPGGELRPDAGFRYRLSVLEADGDSALMRTAGEGGDRGMAGDVFGAEATRLHSLTHPSTRAPSGQTPSVTFHEIVLAGSGARIRLSTDPEPVLALPPDPLSAAAGQPLEQWIEVTGGTFPLDPSASTGMPQGVRLEVDGERIVLAGVPLREGLATLDVSVRDALGRSAGGTLLLEVTPLEMEASRLAQALLGGPAVEEGEAAFLDANGNGNGNLDLGDMRAWRYR